MLGGQQVAESKNYTKRLFVIRKTDMPVGLQAEVKEMAHRAVARYYLEADMAKFLRDYLTEKDSGGGEWHVAVGRNFAASLNYEVGTFIYFYISHFGFLIFKSGAV